MVLYSSQGKSIDFSVFLLSKPLEEVECTVVETYVSGAFSHDLSSLKQLEIRPNLISFLPATFAKPLSVSVNGVKDGLADGDVTVSLNFTCSSVDAQYNSSFAIPAAFTAFDTDSAGMRVLRSDGTVLKAGSPVTIAEGATESISIRFVSRPFCANCTIKLAVEMVREASVSLPVSCPRS